MYIYSYMCVYIDNLFSYIYRTSDPHLWTDVTYPDLTTVQSILALDDSRVPAIDINPRLSNRDPSMTAMGQYNCANIDSVTVPDGWAVVRGFNFIVDETTDVDGWQYSANFDDASTITTLSPSSSPQQMNSIASNGSSATSTSISTASGGNSAGNRNNSSGGRLNSTGGRHNWSNRFDVKTHNVRRRQWCRVMVPSHHLQTALDVCDRYVERNARGHIFSSSSLYIEIGLCCGKAYQQLKVMLYDDTLIIFKGTRKEGEFSLTAMTRVAQTDSRSKEFSRHPFLFRLEDTSDPFTIRFLCMATSDPLARIRWMDVLRNHIGLMDKSGRDVVGGPPDDPSVPIYSSSLVSIYIYTLICNTYILYHIYIYIYTYIYSRVTPRWRLVLAASVPAARLPPNATPA